MVDLFDIGDDDDMMGVDAATSAAAAIVGRSPVTAEGHVLKSAGLNIPDERSRMLKNLRSRTAAANPKAKVEAKEVDAETQKMVELSGMIGSAIGKALGRKTGGDGGDLLDDDDEEGVSTAFLGARGAAANEKEKHRFLKDPDAAFADTYARAREVCGAAGPNTQFRMPDLLPRLPCGTYNTTKRCLACLLEIMEYQATGQEELARGMTAQMLRWLSLSLFAPNPELAWRVTFLADPMGIVCQDRSKSMSIMENGLSDPRQITAVMGMTRDLDTVNKKFIGGGKGGDGKGKGKKLDADGNPIPYVKKK